MSYNFISILTVFNNSFNQSPDIPYIWSSIGITFAVLALNLISAILDERRMNKNEACEGRSND